VIERLKNLLRLNREAEPEKKLPEDAAKEPDSILQEVQLERLEHDISILDESGQRGQRVEKEAEKEVREAAEDTLKKLHVIQRGRCPKCGEHLHKHFFVFVCDACGWHTYDAPREGPVRVHLSGNQGVLEGDHCYVVTAGTVILLRKDVVIARVPPSSVQWIEYVWNDEEIGERYKQLVSRMTIMCGWCSKEANPESDGFHLVHLALGATQERYCFCTDACYEAFRKMYPSRVHRDCYERDCADCDLCIKRYSDEADEVYTLAKDYLKTKKEPPKE
jgi:hypothetical protein